MFLLPMFLLMLLLLTIPLNSELHQFCLRLRCQYKLICITPFSYQAIVTYNVVKKKKLEFNCFSLHIAHNNLSAKDVNLLRTMLHCVQAFTFDKTISTSTTNFKCRCEFGKTLICKKIKTLAPVKGLGNSIRKTLARQVSQCKIQAGSLQT